LIVVATILLILYIGLIGFVLKKTFEGDAYYLLLYILFTLPFYTTFQLIIFKGFDLSLLVDVFKISKDFVFFTGFFVFIFGKKESFIEQKWQLTLLDKLFLGFMTLTSYLYAYSFRRSFFLFKNNLCKKHIFNRHRLFFRPSN